MLELAEIGRSFPPAVREGLVAYYRFNKPSWVSGVADSITDLSGNGNHGTLQGGGTLNSIAGKLGQGFGANGTNWIKFPPGVFNQNAGSLFSWIKSNSSLPDAQGRFFGTDDAQGQTQEHRTYRNGVTFPLYMAFRMEAGPIPVAFLPSTFANDTWVFVGWTWLYSSGADETTITGYLNNVAGTPVLSAGKIAVPDRSFNIAEWGGTVVPAPAGVDETTLHDRVITPDVRSALYNSGLARILEPYALPLAVADIRPELDAVDTRPELEVVEV